VNTKEKIEHYTHFIKDKNGNEWKVIETSDLDDILETHHDEQVNLLNEAIKLCDKDI